LSRLWQTIFNLHAIVVFITALEPTQLSIHGLPEEFFKTKAPEVWY